MFLNNYIPRTNKIERKNSLKYIKFGLIFFFFITIFVTLTLSFKGKNKMIFKKNIFDDPLYDNQSVLKVENAKLIGSDKSSKPYVITAASSFKKNFNKNIIFLNYVEADITLNNNSWMLLHTNHATFNVLNKTLKADEKVSIFYDNGTKLETNKFKYNVSNGNGLGQDGVKMLGEWGIIVSDSFSFDTNEQKLKFFKNPKLVLN